MEMAKKVVIETETPEAQAQPEKKRPDNKPKGWHSRRHESPAAHYAATERYQAEHGPAARRAKAETRMEATIGRTPEEQLARLDARLGYGLGAAKERARLMTAVAVTGALWA